MTERQRERIDRLEKEIEDWFLERPFQFVFWIIWSTPAYLCIAAISFLKGIKSGVLGRIFQ